MNFLAHIALSGTREEVIMGNFSGDFIKGKLTSERTAPWAADYIVGVQLHRYIDLFTDTHAVVRQAKAILNQTHPKVAGVILDIYMDYFLANHFSDYYSDDLYEFSQKAYDIIRRHRHLIPEAMLPMADAMIRHDWLYHYREISGIKRSFDGLANRYSFMQNIRGAEIELERNYNVYEDAFLRFYPQLAAATFEFLKNHKLIG